MQSKEHRRKKEQRKINKAPEIHDNFRNTNINLIGVPVGKERKEQQTSLRK